MSAPDWTEPFTAPNMLDAPRRGQGEPSPAALLMGRLAYRGISLSAEGVRIVAEPADRLTADDNLAITEHALELLRILNPDLRPDRPSLDEQTEAEAALALQTIGREPTAKEAEQAKADAAGVLAWLRKNWHGSLTMDEGQEREAFFRGLEALLFNAGVLSILWGLSADRPALRDFLGELRRLEDRAGPEFQAALRRAQFRESEEWLILSQAAHMVAAKAQSLNSPRLEKAAELIAAMLSPDKLRPEAPSEAARRESSRKANETRSAARDEIWDKIEAAMKAQRGMKAVDARAAVAKLALQWNREAPPSASGKAPFGWKTEAQAAEAIRLHLMRKRKKK